MGTVFRDAILVQFDPPRVDRGELRVVGARIAARGETVTRHDTDVIVNCAGAVLMPGLVNGHTHLYSALAPGMPAPPVPPTTFHDILRFIWWRLDRAHTHESVRVSGVIGAMDALRCGTTTLIDHHASPSCIEGSLDELEHGIADAGCRAVLCYEVTDRNGLDGAATGLAENERYLQRCAADSTPQFAGLVGAHASFTLSDDTLTACADLARRTRTGLHLHVAEDPVDERLTQQHFKHTILQRFEAHGLLEIPGTVFAHGTHLDEPGIAAMNARHSTVTMAHNPRSNMNNAVGYAPAARFSPPPMLGTDGIDGDLWTEAKTALFKSHDAGVPLPYPAVLQMLGASARRASAALRLPLGVLEEGAAADLVLTDYRPATPLTGENLAGHLIFTMNAAHVRSVMVDGRWRLRDRTFVDVDEVETRAKAIEIARCLHARMAELPCD